MAWPEYCNEGWPNSGHGGPIDRPIRVDLRVSADLGGALVVCQAISGSWVTCEPTHPNQASDS